MNKMLTRILRLIVTSYSNSTCEKDLICSFLFIYDEEVTLRKKNLYWDILQQLKHVNSLVLFFLSHVALRCSYAHF